MRWINRTLRALIWLITFAGLAIALACTAVYIYLIPLVPSVDELRDIKLQTPLRIYDRKGVLLAEYGEERRAPLDFSEIPEQFVQALIAIEDHRFETHQGVDLRRFVAAVLEFLTNPNARGAGGSTLTQQVAREYFLHKEKTLTRKFTEIILSFQMETLLKKEEIFELYANKMYLGHRAYGIQAAAKVYYDRDINALTLAELATIAGLHQLPSAANPISYPERSKARRDTVLFRMHQLGYITDFEYKQAIAQPVTASKQSLDWQLDSFYVAELIRQELYEQYGDSIYSEGYKVYTTIDINEQVAANHALTAGLSDYSRRHGYTGVERSYGSSHYVDPPRQWQYWLGKLRDHASFGGLDPAIVVRTTADSLHVLHKTEGLIELPWEVINWAREAKPKGNVGDELKSAFEIAQSGDLVRIEQVDGQWWLSEVPGAQAALVALNPEDGAVTAMVGGFDYRLNKYNRATQALRQPGSNFKPFVYSAALSRGWNASTLFSDAPVTEEDGFLEGFWRPKNSGDRYLGFIPMRQALYQSRNAASIRLLKAVGLYYALDFVERYGFDPERLDRNLGLVLGSSAMAPIEIARAYAVIANGGYLVDPYFIHHIEDQFGNIVMQTTPKEVCREDNCGGQGAPRVLDAGIAYIVNHMLLDTVKKGTATRALVLERDDLAGKTGTTNDAIDAWFTGFNSKKVASVWVGFDDSRTLGASEFGGKAALPIWIDYMRVALADIPEQVLTPPENVIQVWVDRDSGQLTSPNAENSVFEVFLRGQEPTQFAPQEVPEADTADDLMLQLFGGEEAGNEEAASPLF